MPPTSLNGSPKEIAWAIEKEEATGLPFLLPIMCDPEAWEAADPRVRQRKFLQLQNQEEESISKLGRELTSEVLGWMSLRLDKDNSMSPGVLEAQSNAELLRTADQLFENTATQIKSQLLPHRSDNPIRLSDFTDLLRRSGMGLGTTGELTEMLDRLRAMHRLNGVEYDDEFIFLSRENYSFKADLHTEIKRKIARRAARRGRVRHDCWPGRGIHGPSGCAATNSQVASKHTQRSDSCHQLPSSRELDCE